MTKTITKVVSEADEVLQANARLMQRRKEVKISFDRPEAKPAGQRESSPPVDIVEATDRLCEVGRQARIFAAQVQGQLAGVKQITCKTHGCMLKPDFRRSVMASRQAGQFTAIYEPCPQCHQITSGPDAWKLRAGISMEFMEATLDNWIPKTEEDFKNLQSVQAFRKQRTGFLTMLGQKGTGKTHLAVGLLTHWRSGLILTQADLLYRLRRSYGDSKAEDIIERCKAAALLVIDEIGLSVGGKDELPMLHEILNFRHTNFKPTVLIGNIGPGELAGIVGERMIDRLRQSLFHQLIFTGKTVRGDRRNEYAEAGKQFQRPE